MPRRAVKPLRGPQRTTARGGGIARNPPYKHGHNAVMWQGDLTSYTAKRPTRMGRRGRTRRTRK